MPCLLPTPRRLFAAAALPLLAAGAAAQSLVVLDPFGRAVETTGPAAGACGFPSGPVASIFDYEGVLPCLPAATGGGPQGGISGDRLQDTTWITDGVGFAEYQPNGAVVRGFRLEAGSVLAGEVTGIGWDAASERLWICDGDSAAALTPSQEADCDALPVVAVAPFGLPIGEGNLATALDWDPVTGALWVADDAGFVTHVLPTGIVGPLGAFDARAAVDCPLTPALSGVAVDTSAPAGTLYVSDGLAVGYVSAGTSAQAQATFYTPLACYGPAVQVEGLFYAARGIDFGTATDGGVPVLRAVGQSVVPNIDFALEVSGGVPGSRCGVVYSLDGPQCPAGEGPIPAPVWLGKGTLNLLADTELGKDGSVIVPAPMLPTAPLGVTVYLQGFLMDPLIFNFESTQGIAITTSVP